MSTINRPALRYFGGKWKLADWIISHFPRHEAYVESFGGAASVLLNKKPVDVEIYNDLNSDLVNFFRVLRNRPDEFVRLINLTPYAREEFDDCADWECSDELEKARRFCVRSWQGFAFGGQVCGKNTWSKVYRGQSSTQAASRTAIDIDSLIAASKRIRSVQIEHINALELIIKSDEKGMLHYVDPPYDLSTRTSLMYAHDELNQSDLADVLNSCKGMVVLSGYNCPDYAQWYSTWHRYDKSTDTNGNNNSKESSRAIESLWLNEAAQKRLNQHQSQLTLLPA